jgi:hypothetical protein
LKGKKVKLANKKKKSGSVTSSRRKTIGMSWLPCSIHGIEFDTSKGCPACKRNKG